jgi:hypothetical protein
MHSGTGQSEFRRRNIRPKYNVRVVSAGLGGVSTLGGLADSFDPRRVYEVRLIT